MRLNCRLKTSLGPKGTFPLLNTVHTRNLLQSERPFPIPPELWWQPLSGSSLRSHHSFPLHSPHSSTSLPQSERGGNKPHVSGKNLEQAASQTKVPRALLPFPPGSLSSPLSLGRGWMLLDGLVGWLQRDKARVGVKSSSAGNLGEAKSVLHWHEKVLPLELIRRSRMVALSAEICALSRLFLWGGRQLHWGPA